MSLLNKYVNVLYVGGDAESSIPDDIVATIKEALISYRTKTYKIHRIKAYEVFRNVSSDRIAKFAPCTIDDLRDLRCLDEAQLTLYGQDIVDIVQKVMNS